MIKKNIEIIMVCILVKEGTVDNMIINESTDYKEGDWLSNESVILITFHGK